MPQITQWDEFEYFGNNPPNASYRKRSIVTLGEQRSKYIATNSNNDIIFTYRVDGGIIQGNSVRKCDFLFLHDKKNTAYFIELKGEHFNEGIKQLELTITNRTITSVLQEYTFKCRLSCTQIPSSTKQNEKLKAIKRFKDSYNAELRIEKTPFEEPKL